VADQPDPDPDEVEDLPDLDYADPFKRKEEDDEDLPGLDPTLTIPPE
jgi:hypothetical protein